MGRTTALRAELKQRFFPFVEARGFTPDMVHAPQFFSFRRSLPTGVHVFDLQFEKYGRPRFVVNFGMCSNAGALSHGEQVSPERILPSQTPQGGRLQPGRGSRTSSWFRQDRSLFDRLTGQADHAPFQVVGTLIDLFPELESYWSTGTIGPHMRALARPWVRDLTPI